MRITMDWARGAAIVAGLNLAIPQAMVFAAEAPVAKPVKQQAAKDIKLTVAGELNGRVVTAEGKAVDGAAVTISQNNKPVAKTISTASGEFKVSGLKTGLYQVSAGQQSQFVRVWPQDVAPPSAVAQATLVQSPVVRAQDGMIMQEGMIVRGQDEFDYLETDEIIIGITAATALGIGIGALIAANDDDDNNNTASP